MGSGLGRTRHVRALVPNAGSQAPPPPPEATRPAGVGTPLGASAFTTNASGSF